MYSGLSFTSVEFFYEYFHEILLCIGTIPALFYSALNKGGRKNASESLAFFSFINILSFPFLDNPLATAKSLLFVFFFAFLIADKFCYKTSENGLVLMSFSLLGALLMISANDWFMLFLASELLALSSCALIALLRTRRSLEASLKYFAVGALGSSLFILGAVIFFTACGQASYNASPGWYAPAFFTTSLFVIFFLIKIGVAPFHTWVADAYEGSAPAVTLFLAVVVKFGALVAFMKILSGPFFSAAYIWQAPLVFCSGVSIIVGCFSALYQKRLKRLLAFSSINNIGYVTAAFSCGTFSGMQAGFMYLVIYLVSFGVLFSILSGKKEGDSLTFVSDLHKLRKEKTTSFVVVLCLFSMAGIPPLSGFWTKYFIIAELFTSELYLLGIVAAITSVVSSFYYINLIKILLFEDIKRSSNYVTPFNAPLLHLCALPFILYPLAPVTCFELSYYFTKFFYQLV